MRFNMKLVIVVCFLPLVYAAKYFQFVQQWPTSFCNFNDSCSSIIPSNFTIHGLWPSESDYGQPQPRDCMGRVYGQWNQSAGSYDPTLMDPNKLDMDQLELDWPDLLGHEQDFWRNEWNEHGTCSFDTLNQVQYFQLSMGLKKQLNLLNFLKDENIVPTAVVSTTFYSTTAIFDAIKKSLAREPRLWCVGGDTLLEISTCLDYQTKSLIDCPPLPQFPSCAPKVKFQIAQVNFQISHSNKNMVALYVFGLGYIFLLFFLF